MAAQNKTETISAAAFRALPVAGKGRKAAPAGEIDLGFGFTDADIIALKLREQHTPKPSVYTFTYSGKVVSNNKTYSGMHWTKRNALTELWHGTFTRLMSDAGVQPMQRFALHLRFNSRHDVDNLSLLTKWAVDAMKGRYIPDDTKKHYRGIHVEADETLPHNTFVFTLTEIR